MGKFTFANEKLTDSPFTIFAPGGRSTTLVLLTYAVLPPSGVAMGATSRFPAAHHAVMAMPRTRYSGTANPCLRLTGSGTGSMTINFWSPLLRSQCCQVAEIPAKKFKRGRGKQQLAGRIFG